MKPYRQHIFLLLLFSSFLPCWSERYTIVKLIPSGTAIKIGHNICRVGDEFDDKDTIFWNNSDTLIMNVLCNDRNCYAPRLTLFFPQNVIHGDEFISLHRFLFTQAQALVGYGFIRDTIYIYPYSSSSIHIFQHEEECLYAHIANSNLTFEIVPENKQYFISANDFNKDHGNPVKIEIYNSPCIRKENIVRTFIVVFEK